MGINADYDAFYGLGHEAEVHGQDGTGNPFVDSAHYNFHLKAHTSPGTNLGSPYNVDIDGNTRSMWDIGAYEYVGTSDPTPPAAPRGLRLR